MLPLLWVQSCCSVLRMGTVRWQPRCRNATSKGKSCKGNLAESSSSSHFSLCMQKPRGSQPAPARAHAGGDGEQILAASLLHRCLAGRGCTQQFEWRSTNATSACLSLHGSFPLGFMEGGGGGGKGFLLSFTSPGFCLAALGSKHWVMGGDHHPPPRPVLESALRPPGAVHDEDK